MANHVSAPAVCLLIGEDTPRIAHRITGYLSSYIEPPVGLAAQVRRKPGAISHSRLLVLCNIPPLGNTFLSSDTALSNNNYEATRCIDKSKNKGYTQVTTYEIT